MKTDPPGYVLDSSALIALVHGEPGADSVRDVLESAVISAVNLTETVTKLIRQGGKPKMVERYLRGLPLPVVPWDETLAWESLDLCSLAWTYGISFADRACLTLARHLGYTAITSDATWKRLGTRIPVILFRQPKSN